MPTSLTLDLTKTYRYLRWTVIALLGMLLVSVVVQASTSGCLLGSISAYYFTPVHAVFVGSLFALGAALIAYQGHSSAEDTLLNYSGFMAFVVAMVPTSVDRSCDAIDQIPEDAAYRITDAAIARSVTNNIWSLIVVMVAVIGLLAFRRGKSRPKNGHWSFILVGEVKNPNDRAWTVAITIVCSLILIGELTLFLMLPTKFISFSHGLAASTMVLGVIAVMVLNVAVVKDRHATAAEGNAYRAKYIAIAVVLGAALIGAVAAAWIGGDLDHLIFWAEIIVLAAFVVFWLVQSKEFAALEAADRAEAVLQG